MHWTRRAKAGAIAVSTGLGVVVAVGVWLSVRQDSRVTVITGAVITQDPDLKNQAPVGNATLVATYGKTEVRAVSQSSGLFRLEFPSPLDQGETVDLRVEHADYLPLSFQMRAGDQLQIVRLARSTPPVAGGQEHKISNIRVRYATRTRTTVPVGSIVRTFEVANKGNVPCQGRQPCSPDGKWKAAVAKFSVNAEEQNTDFRNVRVSCLAGPCPFTAIESDGFSRGGRVVSVSVRNWSDSVTYLLEAEVVRTTEAEAIRYAYPVTFGRSMNFTLPPPASGPSVEADLDNAEIVFPLGPGLVLSWASCRVQSGADGGKQYRCALNPGYRFE